MKEKENLSEFLERRVLLKFVLPGATLGLSMNVSSLGRASASAIIIFFVSVLKLTEAGPPALMRITMDKSKRDHFMLPSLLFSMSSPHG